MNPPGPTPTAAACTCAEHARSLVGLLILIPSYGPLDVHTELSLEPLRVAGARIIRSIGCSDVALHRCIIAGMAERLLGPAAIDPDEPHPVSWLLWLDSDVVAAVPTVAEQIDRLELLRTVRGVPRDEAPALSGCYMQRTKRDTIAARVIEDEPPIAIVPHALKRGFEEEACRTHWLFPVHAGMGCLMQLREAFARHCAEAERTSFGGETIPIVTCSGMHDTPDGGRAWGSEDFTYCAWEWTRGRGVYLDRSLHYGHAAAGLLYPSVTSHLCNHRGAVVVQDEPAPETDRNPRQDPTT